MKINKLQIIIIGVALAAALAAVLIFSGVLPGFGGLSGQAPKRVLAWGVFPENALSQTLANLKRPPHNIEVVYAEKNAASFERELIDALARQAGPDVIIFPQELIKI